MAKNGRLVKEGNETSHVQKLQLHAGSSISVLSMSAPAHARQPAQLGPPQARWRAPASLTSCGRRRPSGPPACGRAWPPRPAGRALQSGSSPQSGAGPGEGEGEGGQRLRQHKGIATGSGGQQGAGLVGGKGAARRPAPRHRREPLPRWAPIWALLRPGFPDSPGCGGSLARAPACCGWWPGSGSSSGAAGKSDGSARHVR